MSLIIDRDTCKNPRAISYVCVWTHCLALSHALEGAKGMQRLYCIVHISLRTHHPPTCHSRSHSSVVFGFILPAFPHSPYSATARMHCTLRLPHHFIGHFLITAPPYPFSIQIRRCHRSMHAHPDASDAQISSSHVGVTLRNAKRTVLIPLSDIVDAFPDRGSLCKFGTVRMRAQTSHAQAHTRIPHANIAYCTVPIPCTHHPEYHPPHMRHVDGKFATRI